MSGKEALYKKKAPGLANREVRAKLKTQKSKANRDELLDAKRRIPLSVLQDQSITDKTKSEKLSVKDRSDLRLEKLKEWRKVREAAKMKDKKSKKPFNFSGLKSIATSKTSDQNNIFVNKPWSTSTKPKLTTTKPTSTITKPKEKTSMSKSKTGPSSSRQKHPAQKAQNDQPPPKKTTVASSKPSKAATSVSVPKSKQPTKVTKPVMVSTRQSTKRKEPSVPTKTRPQTRSMSKSTVSKVKTESKNNHSAKMQTRGQRKQAVPTKNTERSVSTRSVHTRNSANATVKDTEEAMEITIENPPATEEDGETSPPPTPSKRYHPVRPSPLLRSTSARRRETLFSSRPLMDPAWIPGQANNTGFVQPNFDEAFGGTCSFSPFRFGSSNPSSQFTFRKEISLISSDSLNESPVDPVVTPDAKIVRRSLGSARKNTSVRNISMDENAMIVEVINQSSSSDSNEEIETEEPIAELKIDIPYFRKLHSDVIDSLTILCNKWDGKVASLEEDQTDGDNSMEEVLGQVRTTICQGRLLMRQKLKQYVGLVDIAVTQSGERKTTAEDLQGFWDMVYYQVEDLYQKFKGLDTIESNGWTLRAPTPKKKKTKKRQPKKAAVGTAEDNEKLQAAREKREAQRNRLKEMKKLAAKRARDDAVVEQENFSTPKKSKTDISSPKTGSAYKNGKRRSIRLRTQSVFSPCPAVGRSPFAEIAQDVPVASLVSFD